MQSRMFIKSITRAKKKEFEIEFWEMRWDKDSNYQLTE